MQALYNFLINCKSAIPTTGPNAGIPPTLLGPIAFRGATLNALKVRECKTHLDNEDYYSLELTGPILPQIIHNICEILPKDQSFTATFANLQNTLPFSKVTLTNSKNKKEVIEGSVVFSQENLSDCGLKSNILKHFCSEDNKHVTGVEGLKYSSDTISYSWN